MRNTRWGQMFLSVASGNFKLIEHAQRRGGPNENYWHFVSLIDTSLPTPEISFSFTDINPLLFVLKNETKRAQFNHGPLKDNDL